MKRLAVLLIALAVFAAGCASMGGSGKADFSSVAGSEWILSEVRGPAQTITLNRETNSENFTLQFGDNEGQPLVSGRASPNRYFGPYTLGDNQAITFEPGMGLTRMANLLAEAEDLTEDEFIAYLGNVVRWSLDGRNLQLHSIGEDGTETVLVFEAL
jgi:heat shock protein HslJ